MARTARVKKTDNGTSHYHLMSRANDRRFLFEKGRVKTQLVDALKRAAAFSGVELEAYVAMDNHFHIVCKVVRGGDALPEGELIRRVAALKGERAAEDLASHWEELRGIGMDSAVAEAQERLRARMNDVSEFIKTFKELFNVWFKREHGYSGSIWDGRFKSTLVEDGRYRAICMRYVYLNPVRAGMVKHAADYAWSWIATPDGTFAGSVPEEKLMRRVAQIGAGKIFWSLVFVTANAFALGDRFRARSVAAREVGELGYATHGWRLARAETAAQRPA
jgi:REP element-mobilizing transposase RayT